MVELPFTDSYTKYIKRALVIITQKLKKIGNTKKRSKTLQY